MQRRIAALGVVVAGVVVLATLFVTGLFSVAPDFEEMTDGFRPVMQQDVIDQAKADVAALDAVTDEFAARVVPGLSQQLGMTPEEFSAFMGAQFPAVAQGLQVADQAVPQFTAVNDTLEAELDRFSQADQLPTADLPATTMPWLILLIGLATLVVGGFMLWRARLGAILAIALGVIVVAASLLLSFVPKASAADTMNDNLRPVYTGELVTNAEQAVTALGAMGQQMQTEMLPALAQQLQMDPAALQGMLVEQFPATAGVIVEMPAMLQRFGGLVGTFDAQLDNYLAIQDTALTPVAWIVLVGGIATLLLGGWALLARNDGTVTPIGTKLDADKREAVGTAG